MRYPDIRFIQAANYARGRARGPARYIVVHCTGDHEHPDYAEDLGRYFAAGAGGRDVSAHFGADSNSEVQYVDTRDTAWCAMHTANDWGIHVELSGLSTQSRSEWLDSFGVAMLRRAGRLIARLCKDHYIPVRYLTDAQLRAGERGITSHAQVTAVIGEGNDHTDPGPHFPYDVLLAEILRAGQPDQPTEDEENDMRPYLMVLDGDQDPDHPDGAVYALFGSGEVRWIGPAEFAALKTQKVPIVTATDPDEVARLAAAATLLHPAPFPEVG